MKGPLGKISVYVILAFFTFLFIFPFLWLVSTSLKAETQAMVVPPVWIPSPFVWNNYVESTQAIAFWKFLWNTCYLCFMNVIGTTLVCAFVAYGFSRIDWPGRDKIFALSLATMMIPGPVLLVPLYTIFHKLGWVGSFKPLWIPAWFGSAWNIFLLRQFFMGLSKELTEAAEIDGCSHFRIFFQIILPLSKPALAVVALFCFMFVWKDFMGPLIYLTDPNDFTLALGLQAFQSKQGGTDWTLLMAASTLMVLPVIILFFFAQRTFIEGISMTGTKG